MPVPKISVDASAPLLTAAGARRSRRSMVNSGFAGSFVMGRIGDSVCRGYRRPSFATSLLHSGGRCRIVLVGDPMTFWPAVGTEWAKAGRGVTWVGDGVGLLKSRAEANLLDRTLCFRLES